MPVQYRGRTNSWARRNHRLSGHADTVLYQIEILSPAVPAPTIVRATYSVCPGPHSVYNGMHMTWSCCISQDFGVALQSCGPQKGAAASCLARPQKCPCDILHFLQYNLNPKQLVQQWKDLRGILPKSAFSKGWHGGLLLICSLDPLLGTGRSFLQLSHVEHISSLQCVRFPANTKSQPSPPSVSD